MKLKFYSKWVLLVCFVFFQHASLWSQTSFDPITLENTSFNIYSDFRYLYIAGDENPISIREPNDLKIAFSKNIVTSRGKFEDSIYYPSFSYNIPKKKVRISNLSLGYSPLPHLYGIANFSLLNEKDVSSSAITNMIIGDIGIGTYFLKKANSRPFLKEKFQFKKLAKLKMTSRGLLINALVGYSRGRINYTPSYKVGLGQFILNRIYGKVGFDYQAGFFGIARIEAAVQIENQASIKVLEAAGFSREGLARGLLKINGQWRERNLRHGPNKIFWHPRAVCYGCTAAFGRY